LSCDNKNNPIDNILRIINGIFHGILSALDSKNQQYHEGQIDAGMVSESLNNSRSGAIRKPANTPAWH
jgi:hypothetical protein